MENTEDHRQKDRRNQRELDRSRSTLIPPTVAFVQLCTFS